jgi:hypothetical protein
MIIVFNEIRVNFIDDYQTFESDHDVWEYPEKLM